MSEELKLGLIGAGRIGKVHAESITRHIPQATIIWVADTDRDAAQMLAAEFGVASTTVEATRIFKEASIDAVLICSSTDTHVDFIQAAARAGKHIFCEKPLDLDLARAQAAARKAEQAGVKLQVGFNRRFDRNFARIRQDIIDGKIGDPQLLRISSRDPAPPPVEYLKRSGGIFLDMTIHDFDMARFLLGEVEEVYARGETLIDPGIAAVGDIDTAVIQLKFDNGALGSIDNSRQAVYGYDQRVEVFGSKGMLQANNVTTDNVTLFTGDAIQSAKPEYFFLERYMGAYVSEMQAFVRCILEDKKVPVTGLDGLQAIKIAYAAKVSLQENRPVRLSEISE